MSKRNAVRGGKQSLKELRRQKLAREKRLRALRIWVPVGLLIIAIAVLVIIRALEPEVEGVVFTSNLPAGQHDSSLSFPTGELPPVGGAHSPAVQPCAVYTDPVDPARVLHALEHGGVWISYHQDLAENEVARLREFARNEFSVLLSPYTDQDSAIVMTAWGVQLQLDSASDERIEAFLNRYRGRGPEGGVGC